MPRTTTHGFIGLVAMTLLYAAAPTHAGWTILYDHHDFKAGDVSTGLKGQLKLTGRQGQDIRIVAFTPNGGWVMIAGKNGLAGRNCPDAAYKKLEELAKQGAEIKSVAFTPANGWVILHDKNGVESGGIPEDVEARLGELVKSGAELKSIAFTKGGGWAILMGRNDFLAHDIPKEAFEQLGAAKKENNGLRAIAFTLAGGWAVLFDNGTFASGGELPSPDVTAQLKELCDAKSTVKNIAFSPAVLHLSRDDEATRKRVLEIMERNKVPGMSLAIINDNKVVVARGYGVLEAGGEAAVNEETRFQAGSVSKPVAALGCLRLVNEKKITLDDDINNYLTSWKVPQNKFTEQKAVTLREILSHTAGFNVHGFGGYPAGSKIPTLVEVLNGERPAYPPKVAVVAVPGTKFEYSGGGICVMQQAVIDVTHQPFAKTMEEEVLRPLGMTNSGFSQPLPVAWRKLAAVGHQNGKPIGGKWHTFPELAAAGLWTTPIDLSKYIIGLAKAARGEDGAVLPQDLAKEMLTHQKPGGWGLGIATSGLSPNTRFTHNGINVGFMSLIIGYVQSGQGIAVMVNTDTDGAGAIMDEMAQNAAIEYGWPE